MDEIKKGLESVIESPTGTEEGFSKMSKTWASHSLDTYSGDLLQKALCISMALNGFQDALEESNPTMYPR